MSQFELIAILLVLTATFSWVNFRLAFLPHTIGLLVMGLGASLVVIGAEAAMPGLFNYEGSIRISYALSDAIERNVNAGGAHGPSRLSGLAI